MNGQFAEALRRAGFQSKDGLARRLKARAPEAFAGIQERSLAVKLGELERGNGTWWRNRSDQSQALLDLTGFDANELVQAQVRRASGMWSFMEFHGLPPLDLLKEEPADIHEIPEALRCWLDHVLPTHLQPSRLNKPHGLTWLHVPAGSGAGLLLARLKCAGAFEVLEAESLREAVARVATHGPVVISISQSAEPEDAELLLSLKDVQPVLVVAPNALPGGDVQSVEPQYPAWSWLNAAQSERRRMNLSAPNASGFLGGGPVRVHWRLKTDWRVRLMQWIDDRLRTSGNTLYSHAGLARWLADFDPASTWFSKPTDVLALASHCHAIGERKLPDAHKPDAGAHLLRVLAPLDTRALSQLNRLVELRWLHASRPWSAPMPWDEWECLLASSPDGRARHRSELRLEDLRRDGVLVPDSRGWWTFAHPVQATLLLRDALVRWVANGDMERWATPLIGDPERQARVDAVLLRMTPAALSSSLQALKRASAAGWVALTAAEALFVAVASMYGKGAVHFQPEHSIITDIILRRQLDVLGWLTLPFTRGLDSTGASDVTWLTACWAWSLHTPEPRDLPQEIRDCFPGWQQDHELQQGGWLLQVPFHLDKPMEVFEESREGFGRLFQAAQEVVERVGAAGLLSLPSPGPLQCLLMMECASRGHFPANEAWWSELLKLRETQRLLAESLDKHDIDRAAKNLLPSLFDAWGKVGGAWVILHGQLWLTIFGKSDPGRVLPGLPEATVRTLYSMVRSLPERWQAALAERLDLSYPPIVWFEVLKGLPSPEPVASRLLAARGPDYFLIGALWPAAPQQCLAAACDPLHAWSWALIERCPASHIGQIAAAMAACHDLVPEREQRVAWVLRHLNQAPGQVKLLRPLMLELGMC